MSQSATTRNETPAYLRAGDNEVFAVLTHPTTEPKGICAIILAGGIYNLSFGRNRIGVRIARELAARGYHSLRMDMHGVGESTGSVEEYRLDKPLLEDIFAGVRWVQSQGINQFMVVGSCFGGRTVLAASAKIKEMRGAALFAVPALDYVRGTRFMGTSNREFARKLFRKRVIRGMFIRRIRRVYLMILRAKVYSTFRPQKARMRREVSPLYYGEMKSLVDRKVPVLIAWGTEDLAQGFERARAGALGPLLEQAGSLAQIHYVDEVLHGFPSLSVQEWTHTRLVDWLDQVEQRWGLNANGHRRQPAGEGAPAGGH